VLEDPAEAEEDEADEVLVAAVDELEELLPQAATARPATAASSSTTKRRRGDAGAGSIGCEGSWIGTEQRSVGYRGAL
jgi:hypothetical protein